MATSIQITPYASAPESDESKPLGPVLEFMRLMWAINHGLDRTSRLMQTRFGVTGPQRLVIRIVASHPGLSAGDLARTLHMHPSTLTGILQRLKARGLLRRLQDPSDARRVRLELTSKGKRLASPSIGTVESSIRRAITKWSDSDMEHTRRALTEIAQALDGPEAVASKRPRRPRSR